MSKLFRYRVEIYLGPVRGWVDITADVRGEVSFKRQTKDDGQPDRGSCNLRLSNLAGDYSTRNPAGQYYGLLGRNTPLRVSAGLLSGSLFGRFYGEVSEWPPRWNSRGTDRYVDVEASGILQRTGQGEQPSWSPMRRTIAGSDPVAYWPAEDGDDASMVGSAIGGHRPLTITGTATFADIATWTEGQGYTVRYGSAALVDIAAGAALSGVVPDPAATASAAGWTVAVACDVADAGLSGNLVLAEVETPGGTFTSWRYVLTPTGRTQIIAINGGTATTVVDDSAIFTSMYPHNFSVWQSAVGVITAAYGWTAGIGWEASATVAGTVAGVTRVTVNPTRTTATTPMPTGHLTLWSGNALDVVNQRDGAMMSALFGWEWFGIGTAAAAPSGELATDRLARLCAEEDIPLAMSGVGDPDTVTLMGRQLPAKFVDLLAQCVDVDGGLLFESRDALGLKYRPRASLYNQTPVPITYVGQLAPPFTPVDDADDVRNDVTVKRTGGSSVRVVQTTGRLAAVPPPAGVGVYKTSPELNLANDAALEQQAGWRLHRGTVDRPRYPSLSVELAAPEWQAAPAAVAALLAVDTGDVLEVTGLPTWAAGDARTLVLGYTERISEYTWQITYTGLPAQPWDVAVVDGAAPVVMDGGTLAAAVPSPTWMSMSLASPPGGGLWTTKASAFPLDLQVGEERVRISSITGAASPQNAAVAPGGRGINGIARAWPAGTPVDVWTPAVVAL